jgi:hypothetical protein
MAYGLWDQINGIATKVKRLCCAVDNINKEIENINEEIAQEAIDNPPYIEFVWSDITEGWTKLSFANFDLNGNFTALVNIGNTQRLYGGSNVGLTNNWVNSSNAASYLVSVNDPSGVITSVGDNTFFDFTVLTFVNLPKAQLTGSFTFKGCGNLKYVNLPTTTQALEQTFSGCIKIETININKCTALGDLIFDNISGNSITITLPAVLVTDLQIIALQLLNTVTLIVV